MSTPQQRPPSRRLARPFPQVQAQVSYGSQNEDTADTIQVMGHLRHHRPLVGKVD